jgi:hypothetical protein
VAWAQNVPANKTLPVDAGKNADGETSATKNDKPPVAVAGGTISLHLELMPVQEAFKLIAKQTGVQIIVSTEAHGRIVDLSLSDVPVEVAIREVARAAGLLSLKSEDNTYIIVKPNVESKLLSPIPSFILPPRVPLQKKAAGPSEYTLRMFESKGDVDPEFSIIMRGSAQFDPRFVVEPPPLNLDKKPLPKPFVLPRGGRIPLPQNRMLPIPNQGPRQQNLPNPSNLLKLPPLKSGPLPGPPYIIVPNAAPQQQP